MELSSEQRAKLMDIGQRGMWNPLGEAIRDHLLECESLLREIGEYEYQNEHGDYVISENDWEDWKSRIAALLGGTDGTE